MVPISKSIWWGFRRFFWQRFLAFPRQIFFSENVLCAILTDESCSFQTFRLFFVQFDHACNFCAIFSSFCVIQPGFSRCKRRPAVRGLPGGRSSVNGQILEEELRIASDHAAFLTPAFLVAWINRASIAAAKTIPTGYATAVL